VPEYNEFGYMLIGGLSKKFQTVDDTGTILTPEVDAYKIINLATKLDSITIKTNAGHIKNINNDNDNDNFGSSVDNITGNLNIGGGNSVPINIIINEDKTVGNITNNENNKGVMQIINTPPVSDSVNFQINTNDTTTNIIITEDQTDSSKINVSVKQSKDNKIIIEDSSNFNFTNNKFEFETENISDSFKINDAFYQELFNILFDSKTIWNEKLTEINEYINSINIDTMNDYLKQNGFKKHQARFICQDLSAFNEDNGEVNFTVNSVLQNYCMYGGGNLAKLRCKVNHYPAGLTGNEDEIGTNNTELTITGNVQTLNDILEVTEITFLYPAVNEIYSKRTNKKLLSQRMIIEHIKIIWLKSPVYEITEYTYDRHHKFIDDSWTMFRIYSKILNGKLWNNITSDPSNYKILFINGSDDAEIFVRFNLQIEGEFKQYHQLQCRPSDIVEEDIDPQNSGYKTFGSNLIKFEETTVGFDRYRLYFNNGVQVPLLKLEEHTDINQSTQLNHSYQNLPMISIREFNGVKYMLLGSLYYLDR
jgi:hypothetical protein